LGSGTGKAVIACAMVYPIKACHGIELFPLLHDCAVQQHQQLLQRPEYHLAAQRIKFSLGDIRFANVQNATHIFINATAFFGEMWQQLSQHLEQVNQGTIVITTSKPLSSPCFRIEKSVLVEMSWGLVQTFIQQRI